MKARPYQDTAVAETYKYMTDSVDNGLIVMPTGTGKSFVIGKIVKDIVGEYPVTRIIIATHSRELVAQNFGNLIRQWPDAPAGIHSAGLSKKDVHHKVLFVSIQSVFKKAFTLQRCDILIIDEAHTISRDGQTMWGKFISDLRTINPHMRVLGLSATPYRMDSGSLYEGEGTLFGGIAYEYEILEAMRDGYLCEVIPKSMATKLNVDGVHKRGGEFIEKELQEAVNVDHITKSAVDEIFQYGADRKSWLVFSSGVEHAYAIAAEIRGRGVSCETVTGDTDKGERDRIIRMFREGKIRCLTNNKVLTTGFDAPVIDLIADLNPTQSAGLFVQKIGRGTRPIYAPGFDLETVEGRIAAIAAGTKPNCLLLDFANNLPRHGCIDQIKARKPPEGGGLAPVKDCLGRLPDGLACCTILHASVMKCPVCGYEFPPGDLKIEATATTHAVLSTQVEQIREHRRVMNVYYRLHEKEGGKSSLRVDYMTEGFKKISDWVCLAHSGFPRQKAESWWKRRAQDNKILSTLPIPTDINECLGLVEGLKKPSQIVVTKEGKYDRIIGYVFSDVEPQPEGMVEIAPTPAPVSTPDKPDAYAWDDDIPF